MRGLWRFLWYGVVVALAYPVVRRMLERMGLVETVSQKWFRRVWTERDGSAIPELFADDGVAYGIYGEKIEGPEAFMSFHETFCALFSETQIDVLEEIAEGDRRAIRCLGRLKLADGGKRVDLTGMGMVRVRNGKIVEAYNYWNFLGLLEEMELMPPGSFEAAITGQLTPHPAILRMQDQARG